MLGGGKRETTNIKKRQNDSSDSEQNSNNENTYATKLQDHWNATDFNNRNNTAHGQHTHIMLTIDSLLNKDMMTATMEMECDTTVCIWMITTKRNWQEQKRHITHHYIINNKNKTRTLTRSFYYIFKVISE